MYNFQHGTDGAPLGLAYEVIVIQSSVEGGRIWCVCVCVGDGCSDTDTDTDVWIILCYGRLRRHFCVSVFLCFFVSSWLYGWIHPQTHLHVLPLLLLSTRSVECGTHCPHCPHCCCCPRMLILDMFPNQVSRSQIPDPRSWVRFTPGQRVFVSLFLCFFVSLLPDVLQIQCIYMYTYTYTYTDVLPGHGRMFLCFVFCVLCFMFCACVLCFMFYVLCLFYVSCFVFKFMSTLLGARARFTGSGDLLDPVRYFFAICGLRFTFCGLYRGIYLRGLAGGSVIDE